MSRSISSSSDTMLQQRLQEALQLFQASDTTRAEAVCKSILRTAPQCEAAHVLLARAQRAQGFNKHALQSCKAGIKLLPRSVPLLVELALVLRASGRISEAEAAYRQVLAQDAHNTMALHNLGNLAQARNALDEAQALYGQALRLQPDLAATHFELGNVHAARDDMDAAVDSWHRAVQLQPGLAPAWLMLGKALHDTDPARAMDALQKGLQHAPNDAPSLALLSRLLSNAGRASEGAQCAQMALGMDPKLPLAQYALGLAWRVLGRADEALEPLAIAARTSTDAALAGEATYLLALCHLDRGRYGQALPLAEELIAQSQTDQQRGMARHVLGSVLFDAGRVNEAREHFAQAIRLSPQFVAHRVTHVASSLYVDDDDGMAHRDAAMRLLGTLKGPAIDQARRADLRALAEAGQRRIRVGWLSADFRLHSCAFFLEPLLEQLDQGRFELFAYDTGSRVDPVMARFQALLPNWRAVEHLPPAALAQTMAEDQLDVLIDLAGLTTGGRMEALAAQPAPIQLSWLGYLGTCGHPAIGHRLTDQWVDSPDRPSQMVESPFVLERPYLCYRAPADAPDVLPPPMLQGQAITFGSFNALSKLSDHTVALWSAVLKAVPEARLLLKTKVLNDEAVQAHTLARFAEHGIGAHRLELMGWAPQVEHHLALYHRVDVALDTYPYNGVTTTCEALWMGVPVVSLVGRTACSRQGLTLLNAVGLPELACADETQFVQRCLELVSSPQALATTRAGLRSRMASSPLCDAQGMARALEHVLEGLVNASA